MINSHSLISLDNSNKLFYTSFRGIQQLKWLDGLDKVRLYGNYNTQKQSDKSIILDVLTFNDLVAILTPSKLIIISLSPTPSIIHRILNTSYTPSTHGNLSFNNNNLIFNWSNTLYKVCISDTITSTHHLLHLHITSCHWIKNIILIQSPTHLHLIHPDTFNVLESHPLYTPTQSQFQVLDKASYYVHNHTLHKSSLLNYKSRLHDLTLRNQPIEALQLAVQFHSGQVGHPLTTQLPDTPTQRHAVIQPYIFTLLSTSTRYLQLTIRSQTVEASKYIARLLIDASIIINSFDSLYNDIFDIYQTARRDMEFLEQLEPLARSGKVGNIPPNISQLLLRLCDPENHGMRYEALVLRLNPSELDINGVIKSTRHYKLWRAFIYVHLTALCDFTTPFLHLLSIIRGGEGVEVEVDTLFAYLGHTLSDLVYPTQQPLHSIAGDAVATKAKTDIYTLLFRARVHPDEGLSQTRTPDTPTHPPSHTLSYPYIRTLLHLNARSFFAILTTGFEDGYFNEHPPISRQTMINTLLEMVYAHDLPAPLVAHVEVFVGSNISKYPQFILLPSSIVLRLMMGLSREESGVSHVERELAVQSLLSTFTPTALTKIHTDLLDTFERARFYKILKSVYRSRRRWEEYTRVVLSDKDSTLFEDLEEAFRHSSEQLFDVFRGYVDDIVALDAEQTVSVVEKYSIRPDETHGRFVQWFTDGANTALYLRAVLSKRGDTTAEELKREYITLLAHSQSQGQESEDICTVMDRYKFDASFLHDLFTQHTIIDAQMHLLYLEGRVDAAFECLCGTSFNNAVVAVQTRALEKGAELAVKYTNQRNGDGDAARCTHMWRIVLLAAIYVIQWHSLSDAVLEKALNGLLMRTYNDTVKYSALFSDLLTHFHSETHSHSHIPPQFRTILFMFMESIRCRLEIYNVGARIMDVECAEKLHIYGDKSGQGWRAGTEYRRELDELKAYIEHSEELQDLAAELEQEGIEWKGIFEVPPVTQRSVRVYPA